MGDLSSEAAPCCRAAAGGLGAAFIGLIDAVIKPGVDLVIEIVDFAESLIDADLVITGEGRIDIQTIYGKTPVGVAKIAKSYDIPVICIAGSIGSGVDLVREAGFDRIYGVTEGDTIPTIKLIEAGHDLTRVAQNVAKSLNL